MRIRLLFCLAVVLLLAAARSPGDYLLARGSATIHNTTHAIVVTFADERDRLSRHLFRLQVNADLQPINVTLPAAFVQYRKGELVIVSDDANRFYRFVLDDSPIPAPTVPDGYRGVTYAGYGLAHEIRLAGR